MERAARMQVLNESIGTIKPIDPAMAHEAHDYRLKSRAVAATFHYFARRVLKHAELPSGRGLLLLARGCRLHVVHQVGGYLMYTGHDTAVSVTAARGRVEMWRVALG
jgi:hypothetical protein